MLPLLSDWKMEPEGNITKVLCGRLDHASIQYPWRELYGNHAIPMAVSGSSSVHIRHIDIE